MARFLHPSRLVPFDELVTGLRERVALGFVHETPDYDDDGLTIFSYTKHCTYEQAWDPFTSVARGLVVDLKAKTFAATSMPKFFGIRELKNVVPTGPFEAFEKLDGTCGNVFNRNGIWRAATKGSFVAKQALWAQNWMHRNARLSEIDPTLSLVMEIVYRGDEKRIVEYEHEECVLITAYDKDGYELESTEAEELAMRAGIRMVKRYSFDSIEALRVFCQPLDGRLHEGFVTRSLVDGTRVKWKCDNYLRRHRMLSNLTPLSVWDALFGKVDLESVRRRYDEDCVGDYDIILALLQAHLKRIVDETRAYGLKTAGLSDIELARALRIDPQVPDYVRAFVFRFRRDPAWADNEMTRKALYRYIRPTGDVLPGYTQSRTLLKHKGKDLDDE